MVFAHASLAVWKLITSLIFYMSISLLCHPLLSHATPRVIIFIIIITDDVTLVALFKPEYICSFILLLEYISFILLVSYYSQLYFILLVFTIVIYIHNCIYLCAAYDNHTIPLFTSPISVKSRDLNHAHRVLIPVSTNKTEFTPDLEEPLTDYLTHQLWES